MIRIVCPFCHSPLSSSDLETACFDGMTCLVCPECEHVLLTEEHVDLEQLQPVEQLVEADA